MAAEWGVRVAGVVVPYQSEYMAAASLGWHRLQGDAVVVRRESSDWVESSIELSPVEVDDMIARLPPGH